MADELSFPIALREAQSLTSIPEFKNYEAALVAIAEDLIRWCKGAIIGGRVWPAEAQAHWIVTQARENWLRWQGVAALRDIHREKFTLPQDLPPDRRVFDPGKKPDIDCRDCNDNGWLKGRDGLYEYCSCSPDMALQMGQEWLDRLNNRRSPLRSMPAAASVSYEQQEREFVDMQARNRKLIQDAEDVVADPDASRERKEIAQATLELYCPKTRRKKAKVKTPVSALLRL